VRLSRWFGYGRRIADTSTRLYLKCTNCGVIFPSEVDLSPADLDQATIEDKTYQCPVCAKFDTYGKTDLFYDQDR
jgi:hypothetical protein